MDISNKLKRTLLIAFAALFALGLLIQLIPYGHSHTNPRVVKEPPWDSPATRALVKRACYDCHSYETEWPFYASIAPASWMVASDVDEGRSMVNFSDWQGGNRPGENAKAVKDEIEEGEMPPIIYRLAHAEARLDVDQKQRLIEGWRRTLKSR
jgi:hypothetical protein